MSEHELPTLFDCAGEQLLGIVSLPEHNTASCGVLIIVGGPQYRIGSHRQFVLLARHLAANGIACMRFDYRGMGDASGAIHSFDRVDEDISAAIETFRATSGVRKVILWGLCDGASAACFQATHNPHIAGLVLVNPWVRTESGAARTYLKHYYLQRFIDPGFWKKVCTGGVPVFSALKGFFSSAAAAHASPNSISETALPLPEKMGASVLSAGHPVLILLSGQDYVAKEFEDTLNTSQHWKQVLGKLPVTLRRLEAADHTFSSRPWCDEVAHQTTTWIFCHFAGQMSSVKEPTAT